jgi:hypothetical protein
MFSIFTKKYSIPLLTLAIIARLLSATATASAAQFSQRQPICATGTVFNALAFPGNQGVYVAAFATTSDSADTIASSSPRDARAHSIDTYFESYNMPLAGYGDSFVKAADLCGMDWRLLPAIAVQESSGGKRMLRNNPFGWGSAKIGFASLEEAIAVVGSNLCGLSPTTQSYYKGKTTVQKLWSYNGSVSSSYIPSVLRIMDKFSTD